MQPVPFIPRYKLLMNYNVKPGKHQIYIRFVLGEFVPSAREMGLHMLMVWDIPYGDYPMRQLVFVAETLDGTRRVMQSDRWRELEDKLKSYTTDYSTKLVRYRDGFQF